MIPSEKTILDMAIEPYTARTHVNTGARQEEISKQLTHDTCNLAHSGFFSYFFYVSDKKSSCTFLPQMNPNTRLLGKGNNEEQSARTGIIERSQAEERANALLQKTLKKMCEEFSAAEITHSNQPLRQDKKIDPACTLNGLKVCLPIVINSFLPLHTGQKHKSFGVQELHAILQLF